MFSILRAVARWEEVLLFSMDFTVSQEEVLLFSMDFTVSEKEVRLLYMEFTVCHKFLELELEISVRKGSLLETDCVYFFFSLLP